MLPDANALYSHNKPYGLSVADVHTVSTGTCLLSTATNLVACQSLSFTLWLVSRCRLHSVHRSVPGLQVQTRMSSRGGQPSAFAPNTPNAAATPPKYPSGGLASRVSQAAAQAASKLYSGQGRGGSPSARGGTPSGRGASLSPAGSGRASPARWGIFSQASADDTGRRYLVYLQYGILNLDPPMVYPKVLSQTLPTCHVRSRVAAA